MNELIEEVKAYEALNHISDEIKESLDAQGAQEDSDVLNESLEEVQRPIIDFSKWHDDGLVNDNSNKTDGNKFKHHLFVDMKKYIIIW